jgi:hypothetical protein
MAEGHIYLGNDEEPDVHMKRVHPTPVDPAIRKALEERVQQRILADQQK